MKNIVVEDNQSNAGSSKKPDKKRLNLNKKNTIIALIVVLILAGAAGTVYFYNQYQDVKKNPGEAQQAKNSEETERILGKLRAIIKVDDSNPPTVARVEDPDKLKKANEEFYKDVQKGDYLIVFPNRAIIYRESSNQIVNIAPIVNNVDKKDTEKATNPQSSETPTQTQP